MVTQGQFTTKPVTLHQYSIDNPVEVKYKGIISLLGTSKYIIYYLPAINHNQANETQDA